VHQALGILFASEAEAARWLRMPHAAPVFGGKPPLALLTCGTQDGLLSVRRFLDAARGGLYMPPNSLDDVPTRWSALQQLNAETNCEFYEGLVAKRADSVGQSGAHRRYGQQ